MSVFDHPNTRDSQVFISHESRDVTTLRAAAGRFLERVRDADAEAARQLMARATGNFSRGNER